MKLVPDVPLEGLSPELVRVLGELRRLALDAPGEAGRIAARLVREAAKQDRRTPFMRVYTQREIDIREDLQLRARQVRASGREIVVGVLTILDVLRAARSCISEKSQRMTLTQAQIARDLGLAASQASIAFSELRAVGAVLNRQRAGKSVTWEVDASFASAMPENDRLAAIEAQRRFVMAERQQERRQAVVARTPLRVVPFSPEGGVIEDDRQPPLID